MSRSRHLQISPSPAAAAALSVEQQRFNTLVDQIGCARATLATWQAQIPIYHQAYVKRIEPLVRQWRQARRESVQALDALFHQSGWTKSEVAALSELILDRLDELMSTDAPPDPALTAMFEKHSAVPTRQPAAGLVSTAEALASVDLEPGDDTAFDAEFNARMQAERAREAAKANAKLARASRNAGDHTIGKTSAARWRREAEAQQATRSVREVYRKLVSALHPDREPDAARRDVKTVLMQRVNTAYAANDLLALLELQLDIEQVDASLVHGASAARLTHYNQVLAEQLAELKREAQRVQLRFEVDFGLDAPGLLNPAKLGRLIDEGYRDISAALAECRHEARTLADPAATRQWLKWRRQERRHAAVAVKNN